jgi:tripartite-type tricarboxylate transporter receptor subunit TctC
MTALLEREQSGKGQWVQSSLLQAGIALLDFQAARYLMKGEVPPQVGNDHPTSMPTSAYRTRDGYLNVAASGEGMWAKLCKVIGREDMLESPEFKGQPKRAENRAKLNSILNESLSKKTSAEWIEILNGVGVPCGPIYSVDQVFSDPQVQHLGVATEVEHAKLGRFKVLAQPARLSRTPGKVAAPTPELGEHTDEVLRDSATTRRNRDYTKEEWCEETDCRFHGVLLFRNLSGAISEQADRHRGRLRARRWHRHHRAHRRSDPGLAARPAGRGREPHRRRRQHRGGHVAKAAPDGYTLVLANVGALAVNPHILKTPYDPLRDLTPITMAAVFANVLVVQPSLPVNSVADFIKLAKEKPGSITYASSGIGGAGHLSGELLKTMAQVDLVHVPYKGGGPAMQGFLGGQVSSFFATPVSSISQIRAGRAKPIATTGSKRAALMPDVPTIAESGYPGYEALNWYGYLGPKGMPREIVDRLNRELVRAFAHPQVVAAMHKTGVEPQTSTPEEFAAYIKREYDTWGKVVKQAGIKAQ